ncbi:MAG: hypothetical protein JO270_09965 [Acidobacteriaceae bacterium]|nr:hypothetical protein [Acidobacteriaceae bacterium]MBV8570058.1 hypothetical protein [Acidobacteriaceae bacterium]
MIPQLRRQFNESYTPELYARFLSRLDEAAGTHVEFRCSETPVFLPPALLNKMVRYGQELYQQLADNPDYRRASDAAIPNDFRVPGESDHPLFLQVDFGLVREPGGGLEPKLVEIQGFPSIYAFQVEMAHEYQRAYRLREFDANLTPFLGSLDDESFRNLLKRTILGAHEPQEVVLLEIDPYHQKTLPDFLATERLLGIKIINISEVKKRGRELYTPNGKPIRRIYNRVIVDELIRKSVRSEFKLTDDVDVEWAGHPNWFFRISKFSLPWFRHECVPETTFLANLKSLPDNLDDYVLKPLYSFAGLGVKIAPSREEVEQIPHGRRAEFILQRRMDFVPTIETPVGLTKVEVRIMYIWDRGLQPVTTVIRTGRGKMMGVDFNKDLTWVGASAGFTVRDS